MDLLLSLVPSMILQNCSGANDFALADGANDFALTDSANDFALSSTGGRFPLLCCLPRRSPCVRGKGFVDGGSCAVVGSSKSHRGCVVLLKKIFRDGRAMDSHGGKASDSVESNANFSKTGGGTLVNFSLLKLLKPAYDGSFVMVRALASTRNEPYHPVGRTHAQLSVCPSPQFFARYYCTYCCTGRHGKITFILPSMLEP